MTKTKYMLYTFADGAQAVAIKLSKSEIRFHEKQHGRLVKTEVVFW